MASSISANVINTGSRELFGSSHFLFQSSVVAFWSTKSMKSGNWNLSLWVLRRNRRLSGRSRSQPWRFVLKQKLTINTLTSLEATSLFSWACRPIQVSPKKSWETWRRSPKFAILICCKTQKSKVVCYPTRLCPSWETSQFLCQKQPCSANGETKKFKTAAIFSQKSSLTKDFATLLTSSIRRIFWRRNRE